MTDPRHRRTRSYRGRHRKPTQPQRVVVPVVTLAALSVGGVAVANAVGDGGTAHHARAGNLIAALPKVAVPLVRPSITPVAKPISIGPKAKTKAKPNTLHHVRHPKHVSPPDSLRIVDVHGPCYVQVTTSGGKLVVRRILTQGDRLAFRHHGLDVTLGSAGAVKVAIDGHHATTAGRSGQVRTFRVD